MKHPVIQMQTTVIKSMLLLVTVLYLLPKLLLIQVQKCGDLISGVAVDGYVAGATVFQDLNNDGNLDLGEPSVATNSLGSFPNLSSVNNAPVRIYNGFDLTSNEIYIQVLWISVFQRLEVISLHLYLL